MMIDLSTFRAFRPRPHSPLAPTLLALAFLALAGGGRGEDAPAPPSPPAPARSSDADRTIVEVRDASEFARVDSGVHRAAGTLEVRFVGRIDPHENTVLPIFGPGATLEGRFERIVLVGDPSRRTPERMDDWRFDVAYDDPRGSLVLSNFRPNRPPAFPGAEGFGKFTIGGRGGRAIEVTNLTDAGPGSLRAACLAKGPRTVVFRVSGTIELASDLDVEEPFLTIAGQTAPGDGICLKNHQFEFDTDHMIVRYLRFRPGDEARRELDAVGGEGDHLIFDHCSASWAIDETFSINKGSNFTVQWCMVTESLTKSIHKKGAHGYGGLWGGPGGSFHHNLLAHHSSRNPRASGNEESGLLDVRNNVIFNWGFNSAYGGEMWPRNWIANYYKAGPATGARVRDRIFLQKDPRGRMFADANFVHGFPAITADNWAGGIDFAEDGEATEATLRAREEFVVAPVTTTDAEAAFGAVLAGAGCSLRRDAVDARIVEEARTGTARFGETYGGGGKGIIDSQTAAGGWPELRSEPPPADSDHDGMPDEWERARALDPNDSADGPRDPDGDGYTNLEDWLNSLVRA